MNIAATVSLDLSRGCLQVSNGTYYAVMASRGRGPLQDTRLNYSRIRLGRGLEHHAVVVFIDDAWKKGVIFDPWMGQCALLTRFAVSYPDRVDTWALEVAIGDPRLETPDAE
ncbi:hypothetical protein ACFL6Y_05285 [Elusimicrobiota bacterium]